MRRSLRDEWSIPHEASLPVTRKRPAVIEGLSEGVRRIDIPGMGAGVVDGLVSFTRIHVAAGEQVVDRVRDLWPAKGVFLVPQMCPWRSCPPQTYVSKPSLKQHFSASHPWMSDSLRAWLADRAYREANEQSMKE